MTFAINFSWRDGAGIAGSDAFTWADLGVQVGNREVDAMDMRLRTVRTRFVTSLLPLAEWLVEVWPRLTEERTAATPDQPHSWIAYHSLRAGRGGGPMPDVRIRRLDDERFEIRTLDDQRRPPGISLSFISKVEEIAPAGEVVRELSRIIEAVCGQLKSSDDFAFRHLQERWMIARQPLSLLAGRLGFALDQIEQLDSSESSALNEIANRQELIPLAEATRGASILERLREAQQALASLPSPTDVAPESAAWRAATIKQLNGRPWISGWRAADEFRTKVGIDPLTPPRTELRRMLERQLEWPERQQLQVTSHRFQGVDMLTYHPVGRMPVAITSARDERSQRFRVAKCIYYALCSRDTIAADSPLLPRHSEANAFAAELLAPKAFIQTHTPQGGVWVADAVEDLAAHCGVDPRVIEHQIRNRDLGVVET
jgi:hypothetical protein